MAKGYQGGGVSVDTGAVDNLGDFAFRTLMALQSRQAKDEKFNLERMQMNTQANIAGAQIAQQQQDQKAREEMQFQRAEEQQSQKAIAAAQTGQFTPEQILAMYPRTRGSLYPALKSVSKQAKERIKAEEEQKKFTSTTGTLQSFGGANLLQFVPQERQQAVIQGIQNGDLTVIGDLAEAARAKNDYDNSQKNARAELMSGLRLQERAAGAAQPPKERYRTPAQIQLDEGQEDTLKYNPPPFGGKERVIDVPYVETPTIAQGIGEDASRMNRAASTLDSLSRTYALFELAADRNIGGIVTEKMFQASRTLGRDVDDINSRKLKPGERAEALASALDSALNVTGLVAVNLFSGAAFTDKQLDFIIGLLGTWREANPSTRQRGLARFEEFAAAQISGLLSGVPRRGQFPSKTSDALETPHERAGREAWTQFRKSRVRARNDYMERFELQENPDAWEDEY